MSDRVWTRKSVAKVFRVSTGYVSDLEKQSGVVPRKNRIGRGVQNLYSGSDLIKMAYWRGDFGFRVDGVVNALSQSIPLP